MSIRSTLFAAAMALSLFSFEAFAGIIPNETPLWTVKPGSTIEFVRDTTTYFNFAGLIHPGKTETFLLALLGLSNIPKSAVIKRGGKLLIASMQVASSDDFIVLELDAPNTKGTLVVTEGQKPRTGWNRFSRKPPEAPLPIRELTVGMLREAFGWNIWLNEPDESELENLEFIKLYSL